ncbi:MAG TPA: SRPBCC family protein, partial [Saprospiraceae bacterium]|nr:SRPBCC family protein [Saprospiraceae bacterium]
SQVFDLSRSVDLHKLSTKHTNEEAIAGVTSGLMQLNDTVTWRAKHLGVYQILTTKITQYDDPNSFTDEMVNGIFKSFKHKHLFVGDGEMTMMTDIFFYQSPLGFLGKIADVLFLKKYMTDFLIKRNEVIRKVAES